MTRIDDIEVGVGVDDSGVASGLARVVAEAEGAVKNIDGMEGTVELKAVKRQFDAAIKEGEAQLDAFAQKDAQAKLGLSDAEFNAKYEEVRAKVARLEAMRATVHVKLDYDKNQAAQITNDLGKIRNALSDLGRRVSQTRVNFGPFSTTLGGLAAALSVLLPLLVSVGGAIVALGGSLGAGTLGALAEGAGLLGGFGLAATGVFAAVKPLTNQFFAAKTALSSYNAAVAGFGKNSTQAETALGKLKGQLKQMSPAARDVFHQFQGLTTAFQQRTGGIRSSFLGDISSGLKTARSLLPQFAAQATSAFKVASDGFHQWMEGLRSPEAKGILNNLMSNFTAALPDIMHGLGQFATAFGRIASAASDFEGSFAHGFDRVASDFAKSTANGNQLHSTMAGLVSQTHSWFHLFGATGKLLTTVFAGGAKAGQSMVDDLTHTFNRWNQELSTASGQRGLQDFFQQATEMTKQFGSSLGSIISVLFDFSKAMAPITGFAVKAFGAIADVVSAITHFGPLTGVVKAFGAAFAAAFVASKVVGWTSALFGAESAVQRFLRWIGVLPAQTAAAAEAEAALGTASAEAAGAQTASAEASAAQGEAAAAAVPEVEALAAAEGEVAAGASAAAGAQGLGAVEGAAASAAGGVGRFSRVLSFLKWGGIAAGGIAAFELISAGIEHAEADARKLSAALHTVNIQHHNALQLGQTHIDPNQTYEAQAQGLHAAQHAVEGLSRSYHQQQAAARAVNMAEREYNQAVQQHGKYSLQAAIAAENLRRAEHGQQAILRDQVRLVHAQGAAYRGTISSIRGTIDAIKGESKQVTDNEGNMVANASRARQLAAAHAELTRVLNIAATNTINQGRALRGLQIITGAARQEVGQFARTFKNIPNAQKLLIHTNSTQAVAQVSKVANRLTDLGDKKAVVRILGDTSNASQAFRQLQHELDRVVHKKYQATVDALDKASPVAAKAVSGFMAFARGDYKGVLAAIDKASSPAKQAQGVLQGVAKVYNAVISASPSQAISAAQIAQGAMDAIHDVTHYINIITRHIGHAEGGPDMAGVRSQKVSSPGFFAGEEAPQHPEYIIATNPAYRSRNVHYLAAAAGDLGFSLAEAFAQGGKRHKPKPPPGGYYPIPHTHGQPPPPGGYGSEYTRLEDLLDYYDAKFSNDQTAYEANVARDTTGTVKGGPQMQALIDERNLSIATVGALEGEIQKMLNHDKKQLRGLTPEVKALERQIARYNKEEKIANKHIDHWKDAHRKATKMDVPQITGKSGSDEEKRTTRAHNKALEDKQQAIQHTQNKLDDAKQKLENLKNKEKEAKDKLKTIGGNIRQEYPTLLNEKEHILPERIQGYLNDIQALKDEAAGVGDGGGGGTGDPNQPALDQTATGRAIYDLYRTFGGNFQANAAAFGNLGSVFGTGAGQGAGSAVGGAPGASAVGVPSAAATAASLAAPAQAAVAASVAQAKTRLPGQAPSAAQMGAPSGTVTNTTVHNHFTAPPADPHTWSRGLQWELEAMS